MRMPAPELYARLFNFKKCGHFLARSLEIITGSGQCLQRYTLGQLSEADKQKMRLLQTVKRKNTIVKILTDN